MSLTDDRVLQIIHERLGKEPGRLSIEDIANQVGCHPSTARRAVHRLKNAGRLKYEVGGGYGKSSKLQIAEVHESP